MISYAQAIQPDTTTSNPQSSQPKDNLLELPKSPEELKIKQIISLSRSDAINLGRQNNLQLQIAQEQLKEASANLSAAQAQYFPRLSTYLEYINSVVSSNVLLQRITDKQRQKTIQNQQQILQELEAQQNPNLIQALTILNIINAINSPPTNTNLFKQSPYTDPNSQLDAVLQINYTIFAGGQREAQIRQAQEQINLQALVVTQQKLQTDFDVNRAYNNLQRAQGQVKITTSLIQIAQKNLDQTQALKDAGYATKIDYLKVKVFLANLQQELEQFLSQQTQAQAELAQLLNLPNGVTVKATDKIELSAKWQLSLEESILIGLERRPELKQQLVQQQIAQAQKDFSLAQLNPTLTLQAQTDALDILQSGGGEYTALSSQGIVFGYSITAILQWNFFDGGQAQSQAEAAETRIKQAELNFANTRNLIRQQIEQAYSILKTSEQNYQTAKETLEQAREILNLSLIVYSSGFLTQTDLLQTQQQLQQAEQNFLSSIINYNQALADLQLSTNTPFDESQPLKDP